ncbi:UDP-2,4-diacetamido-2,4,6-trideoxy-beta-L-altropyranose hydrolase [Corallincola platygyrae]|uniref:UDP-2,4-diacetamido-2,4, 6-trideoxy-beta-L-altropyranose hydrolase n=1 Tax=Corallincola platygyrae TaxID=1193278 RepID=A0ABW4XH90_9GAMM
MLALFRCDASISIGSGHFHRCLTLAKQLQQYQVETLFVIRESTPATYQSLLAQNHQAFLTIATTEQDSEQTDLCLTRDAFFNWARANKVAAHCDWLVVDHYELSSSWHKGAYVLAKQVMVIDDLADRPLNCDLLLNQNVNATPRQYQPYVREDCACLLGTSYALLRPEFQQLREQVLPRRKQPLPQKPQLLISMGGADEYRFTEQLIRALIENKLSADFNMRIVISSAYPSIAELKQILDNISNAELIIDCKGMGQLMADSDIAIGAAGTTSWERCCLGLPTLLFTMADNQVAIAERLSEKSLANYLGDLRTLSTSELSSLLSSALSNVDQLQQLGLDSADYIDGKGVSRVVNKMLALSPESFCFKAIEMADADLLFEWQSAPETRKYARSQVAPKYDDHLRWLSKQLADTHQYLFLMMSSQEAVGYLRLAPIETPQSGFEISIYTAPGHYGKGYAINALTLVEMGFPDLSLLAYISEHNVASQKLFRRAGYQPIDNVPGWYKREKETDE